MSWLSKLTHVHLGNIGAPVGAVLGSVIPGVGTSLGAALGQGIGAMGQHKSLGQAALEGAGTYGAGKLASSVGGSGLLSKVLHPNGGGGDGVNLDPNTGLEVMDSGSGGIGGAIKSGLSSIAGGGGSGGSGQPGGTNPWLMGLAGLEGLNSTYLGNKANKLSDQALGSVKDSYAQRAPLRTAGMQGLLNPIPRDTSELTRIRSNNAYAGGQ